MSVFRTVFGLGFVASLACTTTQPVDEKPLAELKERSDTNAILTGTPRGLGPPQVVNRRDFIYALAFGKDDVLAFVHHVTTQMELTATQIEPLRPRFQQPVNATEFDVEDVVVLDAGPGKGSIAVPSRQGIARAFDAKDGKSLHEYIAGIGLVRIAASADAKLLALGATDGRVIILDAGSFALRGVSRIHDGEVHGIAFLPDGRLVTTSFDGTLKVSQLVSSTDATVHVAAKPLKGSGERVFLAHVNGMGAMATVRDARQPSAAVTAAAVKRMHLAPVDGTLPVVTAEGSRDESAVDVGRLVVATLDLGDVHAAVCDACVPAGAELVLGGEILQRATFVDDISNDEIVVKPGEGGGSDGSLKAKLLDAALTVAPQKVVQLPGPGTDVDVAKTGAVLVAFSHAKAERSFDLYDSEKKGVYPEPTPKSAAALVDIEAGTLGKTFVGHRGFTTTAAISPDGKTVVTGGWDKRVLVFDASTGEKVTERQLAWLVRRVRFSPDGHLLGVAAWTPVNALNEGNSDPALLVYPLSLAGSRVVAGR